MAQNKKDTWDNLDRLWRDEKIQSLPLKDRKYAILSDLHLGDKSKADDARDNVEVLLKAVSHYKEHDFYLVLLGDIEELWQFKMKKIYARYLAFYDLVKSFGKHRVIRIYGNHDEEWSKKKSRMIKKLGTFCQIAEAIRLCDPDDNSCILLLHGHQGDKLADRLNFLARIIVKCYKKIEPFIKFDKRTTATRSQITKDYERIFYSWAKKNQVIVICGHSHRAIFASLSYIDRLENEIRKLYAQLANLADNEEKANEIAGKILAKQKIIRNERDKGREIQDVDPASCPMPCYFNDGCGIYTDGLTVIEIAENKISLEKWDKRSLKKTNYQSANLSEICTG